MKELETIAKEGFKLFAAQFHWHLPLRSAGIRVTHLTRHLSGAQIGLFGDPTKDIKMEQLESSMYDLNKKYGISCVTRASIKDMNYRKSEKPAKFPHRKGSK